jgi:hypothetical protein
MCWGGPLSLPRRVRDTHRASVCYRSQVSTASAVDTFQECLRQHKLECALPYFRRAQMRYSLVVAWLH